MARRWLAALAIAVAGGAAGGCLYRAGPPPSPEVNPTAGTAPPVVVAAAPTPLPTVVPAPPATATPVVLATATGVPEVSPEPTLEPDPTEAPALESPPTPAADPSPLPTLVPITPVVHRFVPGESLNNVVGVFLSQRLGRRVSEDEVRRAVQILLEDPANASFRGRPALVYPGQIVNLTSLLSVPESPLLIGSGH